ncbi:MAG: hypothetical protein C0502_11295 [Opitutus sp.]|nr:hypothetical protein [Opitutus sp.]
MTFTRTITVRGWLALVLSAGLCALAWVTAYRWQPFAVPATDDLPALVAERDALRGNEDAVRDALRTQVSRTRLPAWTEQALDKLPEQFGADWQCDSKPEGPSVRIQVLRRKPQLDEWPEYLAFIERWGRTPGVSVESVEMLAEGGAHDRRLTRVAIGLRFRRDDATTSDASRAVPSHGPARVAPAESPAAPRTVGPVTSLRRPGASAEPPAPGPASASFRPDPPGSQAGS